MVSASAEVGINVGISGQIGLFAGSGQENVAGGTGSDNQNEGSEHGEAGWASVFVEKTLGDRLAIGVDYVPSALESETTESVRQDHGVGAKENKVQIDFEDLTTL